MTAAGQEPTRRADGCIVEVGRNHLVQAVSGTWTALVGTECTELDEVPTPRAVQHVSAICQITGGWTGAVAVDMPFMLAIVSAAAMLDRDPGSLLEEDVYDAIGEIANVAAGMLKGRLRVECKMGLPTIFEGSLFTLSVPGAQLGGEAAWQVGRQTMTARLFVPKPKRLALSGRVIEDATTDVAS